MPRPIIEVDVDDSKFQRFVELFSSYQEKLAEQPDLWASIDKAMGGAGDALKDGATAGADALALAAAQADLIGTHLRDAAKAQGEFTRATRDANLGFEALGRTGGRAAQGIGKAFSGAVRGSINEMGAGIAGVAESAAAALGPVGLAAGAIAAAVGAGGAALKSLADVAVTRQRAAYSLGLSPGQQAGFEVYGQQFMGPESLRAAAENQLSYGSAGALATLGINFDDARKMSASDLAFAKLRGAVKAAQANPGLPLENIPAVMQYMALGGNVGDVRNALKMGLPALAAAQAESKRNAARLDLNSSAVSKTAMLKKAAEGAGISAQSWLINNGSGADPAMAKALDALTGGHGSLDSMAHEIGTKVNPAMEKFNHALNVASGGLLHKGKGAINSFNDWFNSLTGGAFTSDSVHAELGRLFGRRGSASAASALGPSAIIMAIAKQKGVDPTLALADAMHESGLNPRARIMDHYKDGTRAGYSTGLFMLNEHGEGAGMTLMQLLDPKTNASVALSEFAKVAKAHPNWSPGEIAAAAERPADPVSYARMVNAIYASLVKAQRAARTTQAAVKVHVTNSTASRVAVSVNAAAQH